MYKYFTLIQEPMASVRKKGKYREEDLVDEFILSKVSEHVDVSRLSDFAKTLNVTETDYQRISGSPGLSWKQQDLKTYQVCQTL